MATGVPEKYVNEILLTIDPSLEEYENKPYQEANQTLYEKALENGYVIVLKHYYKKKSLTTERNSSLRPNDLEILLRFFDENGEFIVPQRAGVDENIQGVEPLRAK